MHEPAHFTRRALVAALPIAALAGRASAVAVVHAAKTDPVFAHIERHKALVIRANTHPGSDDDPGFLEAVREEEAAIQGLGDMKPTSVAGAIAQLEYMAEVEGTFATGGSPLLRCVLTVARGLSEIGGGSLT